MTTILLLTISNVFMTFAWYYHLQNPWLKSSAMWVVILVSWGIALFEYCFQVPGNRIGARAGYNPAQLKIMQEAITLAVFCLFAWLVLGQKLTWNYYVGFGLVLLGVFVVFHFNKPDESHAKLPVQIEPTSVVSPEISSEGRSA